MILITFADYLHYFIHYYAKGEKRDKLIGLYPKGQFSKNTVYLERGMPYFAFVATNAVLVSKIDKS